jgi:hypothetical protein
MMNLVEGKREAVRGPLIVILSEAKDLRVGGVLVHPPPDPETLQLLSRNQNDITHLSLRAIPIRLYYPSESGCVAISTVAFL